MIKDCLRPGVTLDVIKETEVHIGEDSSFTFYPFTRTLKMVETQSLGIFRIMFRRPGREVKKYGSPRCLRHSRFFLAINKAVISLEKAQKLNRLELFVGIRWMYS